MPSQQQREVLAEVQDGVGAMATDVLYFENEEPFILQQLAATHKCCYGCRLDFLHKAVVPPDDLVLVHQERYMYPNKQHGQPAMLLTHYKTRGTPYHARAACLEKRGFRKSFLAASSLIVPVTLHLRPVHRALLASLQQIFE